MSNVPALLDLPKIEDQRGNLTFVENGHLPFEIKRLYWIYDVPGGQKRGGHAFHQQKEVIIALSGSFDVVVHDGVDKHRYHLNRSYRALHVPNLLWRHMENFSTNAVALVIASTHYDSGDYIRDFESFKSIAQ
ncbi:hypothetical protein CRI94_14030 [Longibacter salinarum]|uniref:Sugar 3,4-ketoisomerase QdtA cupin domain-containing protein n=1 Tax=Longibacter salinarum TaxID=1850348 RepID=A0A2A8CV39_9BACT|nr:FdtA/QdtA family cupin domain-containing protein [Longibacter salinarum]PEN12629.1 hypothetical protein CRI94_14030 [Longibacter salinarum]